MRATSKPLSLHKGFFLWLRLGAHGMLSDLGCGHRTQPRYTYCIHTQTQVFALYERKAHEV